jgi:hypothetical protein
MYVETMLVGVLFLEWKFGFFKPEILVFLVWFWLDFLTLVAKSQKIQHKKIGKKTTDVSSCCVV